jgi:predicted O-linked N-acetylglucosamine transferase (SPINDLY family)
MLRFLIPLLRNHDRTQFEVHLYCTESTLQGCAEACCLAADELKDVSGCLESCIAERIRTDGIDILVDFSGHYGGGSLLVAAMRAAPIQVSCPHYPSTTGIPQMDYIFTDRWTCPPGQEHQYSEHPYRLDSGYVVYDPPERARSAGPLPAHDTGSATFGIFQRPAKLSAAVWDAVAEILGRVDHARLLVHHASADLDIADSAARLRIARSLELRGIDPARVLYRGIVPFRVHTQLLSSVDIALDSFPYTGTTTTCDCLWMGVPVVTLAGNTHASRASAGVLMRLGLEDWVACDVQGYIENAVRAAGDLASLAALRQGLRRRVRSSSLVDGARFAKDVEVAYRWMWEQWINDPPA